MKEGALWVAKSGSDAQQARVVVLSNHFTSGNTTGFKKSRTAFEDIIYKNTRQVGAKANNNIQQFKGFRAGTPYYRVLPDYVGGAH